MIHNSRKICRLASEVIGTIWSRPGTGVPAYLLSVVYEGCCQAWSAPALVSCIDEAARCKRRKEGKKVKLHCNRREMWVVHR